MVESTKPQQQRDYLLLELGKAFLKINALSIGDFTTSTGTRTPYYIDLRRVVSFPNVLSLALDCLQFQISELPNKTTFDYFCGVPLTGLIFTSILSHNMMKPLIYSSKESTHRIMGILKPGSEVLIIDDVSEMGKSIETAAHAIRANGGIVTYALSLIDRREGAKESLGAIGVKLHAFTTTHELALTLKENMALSDDEIELVESTLK